MYIPIVPFVPHTTVTNKRIVYSDTVLPLNDSGNNLKVCSINDISEYSLESCLKKIFESNLDVVFNAIQYSKSDKKLYFYTDKTVSTQALEDNKTIKCRPISSKREILEEVEDIFSQEKNKDSDCISLFDVAKIFKKKSEEYESTKRLYEKELDYSLHLKYGRNCNCYIQDFDYDNCELKMDLYYLGWEKFSFKKQEGKLYISSTDSKLRSDNILALLGNELSKLYDEFIQYQDFSKQFRFGINSVNSRFLIGFGKWGVNITTILKDFELTSFNSTGDYKCDCNSNIVVNAIQGKEQEIFQRIFIKIDDCPLWCKEILYEIRQEQLAEEQRLEEERIYKEVKDRKKLEFRRKFFPWIK